VKLSTDRNKGILEGLNIGIVGGSLSACALAPMLLRDGAHVTIFERSSGNLDDRGVGLAMKISTLAELHRRDLIDQDLPYVPIWLRTFSRTHKTSQDSQDLWRTYWRQPVAFHANHWGVLFKSLRKRVPDSIYFKNYETVRIEEERNGAVTLHFLEQEPKTFDLVIFADGYESTGRRLLHPNLALGATKYFLWRGMIDEWESPLPAKYADTISYFGYPFGHGFVYYVPSPEHGSTPGKRRINWAFHETIADKDVPGIVPDEDGYVRTGLRPGAASQAQVQYCQAIAKKYFPPYFSEVVEKTQQPFIQPVMEACSPNYVKGRVCLIGDAAVLSRPHIGGGAGKALDDVLSLVDHLTGETSLDVALSNFEKERSVFGKEVFELGAALGKHLVEATPDWDVMDHQSMEHWWEKVIGDRYWFWINEVDSTHPYSTDSKS
tara:strand:- start:163 stop:1467 length:1305 start_codon:yes stop_codon:yes gene_type:complete